MWLQSEFQCIQLNNRWLKAGSLNDCAQWSLLTQKTEGGFAEISSNLWYVQGNKEIVKVGPINIAYSYTVCFTRIYKGKVNEG